MEEKRFAVDSVEYRDAWVKQLIKRPLSEEERAALTAAGSVIPTMTVNAVWDKLVKPAELLGRVDVTQFPNYVRFPKATTNNAAAAQAVGGTITESSDVLAYVKNQAVLLTGLVNPQVIRTAMMMDMRCIVFVRDKNPSDEMIELAKEADIVLLSSPKRMFDACGILYSGGLCPNEV